jgi:hypothetical protein
MSICSGRVSPIRKKYPFPVWTRPGSYWDVAVAHLPMALLTGLGLILPLWVSIQSLPLLKCIFLRVTGVPCPFCGFTRSLWAISSGDWHFAAGNNPLSLGIYALMVVFFAWHSTALLLGFKMTSGLYQLCKSAYTWWLVGSMFFLNWVYRIGSGLT